MTISRLIRVALGTFLLVAAGLKAHSLVTDPLSQEAFFASPRLLIATIEVEIVLGLWLLSGWFVRAAWLTALGFFGLLAGVSLYLMSVQTIPAPTPGISSRYSFFGGVLPALHGRAG
jgi:hypothetical protein